MQALSHDTAGAKALVTHFGAVLQYAGTSGDTSALAPLSGDGCESCLSIRRDVEQTWQTGGHVEGGALHVVASGPLSPHDGQTRIAVLAARDASFTVIHDGQLTRVVSRDPTVWHIEVTWIDTGWRITAVTHTSPEVEEALRTAKPGDVLPLG